ncbi:MAG: hypothetical protein DMF60_10780, partial [Acidobacteria bacterium]
VDKYLIPWDKTDFSPRFGFAYSLRTKLVLRGGYGIFYGGEENQGGNPNRGESVPFNETVVLNGPTFFKNPFFNKLSDGFPLGVFDLPAPVQFRGVATNFRNPLVHKWNLAIQQEMPFNMAGAPGCVLGYERCSPLTQCGCVLGAQRGRSAAGA